MKLTDMDRHDEKCALLMMTMHMEELTKDLFDGGQHMTAPLLAFKSSLLREIGEELSGMPSGIGGIDHSGPGG